MAQMLEGPIQTRVIRSGIEDSDVASEVGGLHSPEILSDR